MGTATGPPGPPPPAGAQQPAKQPGRSRWTWLLPALAFLAGLALGAAVIAAGTAGDDDAGAPLAAPTAEPSPTGQASPEPTDLVVTVPAVCVEAAELAEDAARQVDDVAAAARDFDARRLQELVDTLQELRPELEDRAAQCRDLAGEGLVGSVTPSPTPAP